MLNEVTIYTDGACKGNPGPGGWGVILVAGENEREMYGGTLETTNNQMELLAAIEALEALKRPCSVKLFTDSKYLIDGASNWIHGWKKNGWRTKEKKPVKNVDLWQRIDEQLNRHDVRFTWVRGHNGDPLNERADALANLGCAPYLNQKGKPSTSVEAVEPIGADAAQAFLDLAMDQTKISVSGPQVVAYTDGSCLKSKAGGWGVVIIDQGAEYELSGGASGTTNNRMEMMAAISALVSISPERPTVIVTDSEYLKLGIEEHIKSWKSKNWRKADGGPVKNLDLWKQLDALCLNRQVVWRWVKGHSNDKYNDWADRLATSESKAIQDAARAAAA